MSNDRERYISEEIFASPGRALCGLLLDAQEKKPIKRTALKRYVGSQYAYAIHVLVKLGLLIEHEDGSIELTERGKRIAECLCKCFQIE